jgi:hypothetical protein
MELEHSFTIPVTPEQAWQVLLDVERIAPCMPGATVDSVDGDVVTGRIKVKVGPVTTAAGPPGGPSAHEQARRSRWGIRQGRRAPPTYLVPSARRCRAGAPDEGVAHTTMTVTAARPSSGAGSWPK